MGEVQPSNGERMLAIDGSDSVDDGKWLSPEEKEKLIRELKERLKEIERLRRELGMAVQTVYSTKTSGTTPRVADTKSAVEKNSSDDEKKMAEEELSHPVSAGRVAEEVEELRVPALEMLDDKPFKKKKQENTI